MDRNLLANFVVNTFGIFTHKTQRSNVIVWEPQMFADPSSSYLVLCTRGVEGITKIQIFTS